MGTASSTRNRQMIKCLRQMDFIRLLSPKIMRCDTSRIESPVELVRSIARREAPSVFFVLFDRATKLSGTDDRRDKKKASLRLFELASMLVRRDHIACFIALDWRKVSANIKKRRPGAILSFRCPHLANTCQNGFVFVLFVAEPCVTEDWSICPIFPSLIGFSEVPMMGFEPIPRFSRERILSPL